MRGRALCAATAAPVPHGGHVLTLELRLLQVCELALAPHCVFLMTRDMAPATTHNPQPYTQAGPWQASGVCLHTCRGRGSSGMRVRIGITRERMWK